MVTKIWQANDIKNHLLAVQTGVRARVPTSLVTDEEGRLSAYLRGCDAVLKCLAERFGVTLEEIPSAGRIQTSELRLKTWTRADIEHHLKVAWTMMVDSSLLSQKQEARLIAYYQGIKNTLSYSAMSFGIEGFTLPLGDGVSL